MLTRVKQLWALPESAATDESVFLERRRLCKAIAAGPALLAGGGAGAAWAAAKAGDDPTVWKGNSEDRGNPHGGDGVERSMGGV